MQNTVESKPILEFEDFNGETKNGTKLTVHRTRCGRFFYVKQESGGEMASELQGLFTQAEVAKNAIKAYMARKKVFKLEEAKVKEEEELTKVHKQVETEQTKGKGKDAKNSAG